MRRSVAIEHVVGLLKLPVVQVSQFRIAFEFKVNLVETEWFDLLGMQERTVRLLIREDQLVFFAPGVVVDITGALLTEDPGVSYRLQIDEHSPQIVGRRRIDGQDLPRRKERLIREWMRGIGGSSGRREEIFNIP